MTRYPHALLVDNSCKLQTESPTVLREKYATKLLITEEKVRCMSLRSCYLCGIRSLFIAYLSLDTSIHTHNHIHMHTH